MLKVKGEMEQAEGKAKFLKDDSFLETDAYKANKEKLEGANKHLLAQIALLRKEQENIEKSADDGVEVDEDLDDE